MSLLRPAPAQFQIKAISRDESREPVMIVFLRPPLTDSVLSRTFCAHKCSALLHVCVINRHGGLICSLNNASVDIRSLGFTHQSLVFIKNYQNLREGLAEKNPLDL